MNRELSRRRACNLRARRLCRRSPFLHSSVLSGVGFVTLKALGIVWALPWTLFGSMLGMLVLMTGGKCQRTGRVLEFWGGAADWLLRKAPIVGGAAAITFGHVVLGRTKHDIEFCR